MFHNRRKKRGGKGCLAILLGLLLVFSGGKDCRAAEDTEVKEAGLENENDSGFPRTACEFWNSYGNQAVFLADGKEDGWICFGSKAYQGDSSSGIHYRTIGWKMVFTGPSGEVCQEICLKLGGDTLQLRSAQKEGPYYYQLYAVSWTQIERRLSEDNRKRLQAGSLSMHLDACMVLTQNDLASGSMTEEGSLVGTVYTTYAGIAGSCAWGDETRKNLKEYFGRSVQNLFYSVQLSGDEGIEELQGAGNYVYGSQVEISAVVRPGYDFVGWEEKGQILQSETMQLEITGNRSLKAATRSNHPPVIEAWDLYFSAREAEAGKITEENILSYFRFTDEEDGELQGSISDFTVEVPGEEEPVIGIPVLLSAVDRDGNKTEKEILLKVYLTNMKKGSELTGTIRFISGAYYMNSSGEAVPESEGGLVEDSVWLKVPQYRQLLYSLIGSKEEH